MNLPSGKREKEETGRETSVTSRLAIGPCDAPRSRRS